MRKFKSFLQSLNPIYFIDLTTKKTKMTMKKKKKRKRKLNQKQKSNLITILAMMIKMNKPVTNRVSFCI